MISIFFFFAYVYLTIFLNEYVLFWENKTLEIKQFEIEFLKIYLVFLCVEPQNLCVVYQDEPVLLAMLYRSVF